MKTIPIDDCRMEYKMMNNYKHYNFSTLHECMINFLKYENACFLFKSINTLISANIVFNCKKYIDCKHCPVLLKIKSYIKYLEEGDNNGKFNMS